MSNDTIRHEPINLLAQADLIQLLARLFATPSKETAARLVASRGDMKELLTASGLPKQELLARALDETLGLVESGSDSTLALEEWMGEYTTLFECGVKCPINETAYIRRDKGAILADVAGFYRAFGLSIAPNLGEKPDHLVCELEFVALLLVLLARAESAGKQEHMEVTRGALDAFCSEHLGEWLPGFCLRLAETTRLPLFANAAGLLEEVWSAVCEQNALNPPKGKVLVSVEDDPGTPYECGMVDAGQA